MIPAIAGIESDTASRLLLPTYCPTDVLVYKEDIEKLNVAGITDRLEDGLEPSLLLRGRGGCGLLASRWLLRVCTYATRTRASCPRPPRSRQDRKQQ